MKPAPGAVALALAAAAGCSSLQPASKYQGMEVKGVTVALYVNGPIGEEFSTASVTNLSTAVESRGAPAVALEFATQAAEMGGEDTHSHVQTATPTLEIVQP